MEYYWKIKRKCFSSMLQHGWTLDTLCRVENPVTCPDQCGWAVWVMSLKAKGCWIDSWSAHMPGLWVHRFSPQLGHVWETSVFLSLSLLPLSLKINKSNLKKKEKPITKDYILSDPFVWNPHKTHIYTDIRWHKTEEKQWEGCGGDR